MVSLVCLFAVQSTAQDFDTSKLNGTHDLRLPAWGPYSKRYAGISHIPDAASGMRFDFSVLPGYYRNKLLVPNVRFESSYFPGAWKMISVPLLTGMNWSGKTRCIRMLPIH